MAIKRIIDSKDREILRILSTANRPLTGRFISQKVNISPPAIKPRLISLQNKGIIKPTKIGGDRIFNRGEIKINAPSKILWGLDIKKRK